MIGDCPRTALYMSDVQSVTRRLGSKELRTKYYGCDVADQSTEPRVCSVFEKKTDDRFQQYIITSS